jgi:hypothetical protein
MMMRARSRRCQAVRCRRVRWRSSGLLQVASPLAVGPFVTSSRCGTHRAHAEVLADVAGGAQQAGQVLLEQRLERRLGRVGVDVHGRDHPPVAVTQGDRDRADAVGQLLVGDRPAARPDLAQVLLAFLAGRLPAGLDARPGRLAPGAVRPLRRRAASSTLPSEVGSAGKRVPIVTARVTIFGTATRAT